VPRSKIVLAFLAHPDDTDNYCPNLMKLFVEAGYIVHICSTTRGEMGIGASHDPHKMEFAGDRLGRIRSKELIRATGFIGIPEDRVHFLGIWDSTVPRHRLEVFHGVLGMLESVKPDIILCPEPYRGYYRHPDHVTVGLMVMLALRRVNPKAKVVLYHTLSGNFYVPAKAALVRQVVAFHKTQAEFFKFLLPAYTNGELLLNGIRSGRAGHAEAYRITSVADRQKGHVLGQAIGAIFTKSLKPVGDQAEKLKR
jgi:LmbE family N-acetylglucosaminyl deacetylase